MGTPISLQPSPMPGRYHEIPEEESRRLALAGFRPAFLDTATCLVHPSLTREGRPATGHELDGLPDSVVVVRTECGRVIAARATLMAGYEREGFFYTRAWAARLLGDWPSA